MSWKVVKLVFDSAPVTDKPLVILLALAEWSQDDGVSWQPIEAIATRTRCSVRRARELLNDLATPNAQGQQLLSIRRAQRTTFYEINMELLDRFYREQNGQLHLWKKPVESLLKNSGNDVEPCGTPGENPCPEPPATTEKMSEPSEKSASQRNPSINHKNQKNQKEPENHQEPETALDKPTVLWIVKKLAQGTAFPPAAAGLSDQQADRRRQFLESQKEFLRKKAT